jgi:MerR family transcriptional regulator, thiopeptide resistance regulator
MAHLVRLREIARLRSLGVPLARMPAPGRPPHDALRDLERDLEARIRRLQRLRAELALLLRHKATLDTPPGFAAAFGTLSRRDRELATLYGQLWDGEEIDDLRVLVSERDDYEDYLDALPADADDDTVEALAQPMAVALARDQARFPWLRDPAAASPVTFLIKPGEGLQATGHGMTCRPCR